MAAELLKVGEGRIWIDPERIDDVEAAITREEIRKLIHEGAIQSRPKQGVSRSRAKVLQEKRRRGLGRGPGRKGGSDRARISKKQAWMVRIRALRKKLRDMKANRVISESVYRRLYAMAGSGVFESIAELERYIETRALGRKR